MMIEISDKEFCCGCNACVQICPKKCIYIYEDSEGFLYPKTFVDQCVDCHLCEKICPVINQGRKHLPLQVFAAQCKDRKLRYRSSSGGVFTLLAEYIINHYGGVVFGACFNEDWEVIHGYTETCEGLSAFRGSKYVQSFIGDSFIRAEEFLRKGRYVMFTGTPCQIAGLKKYLRKEYVNLICVDFICHGVPSPGIFRAYLNEIIQKKKLKIEQITDISFRDKKIGWENYCFRIKGVAKNREKVFLLENKKKNHFIRGFLSDLFLRPSCYHCPARELKSNSDFTLADFWGIDSAIKNINDHTGLNVVFLNSESAVAIYDAIQCVSYSSNYKTIARINKALEISPETPQQRSAFFYSEKRIMRTIDEFCPILFRDKIENILIKWRIYKIIRKIKHKIYRK